MSSAPRSKLSTILTGFAMGAADLVPGVSGGTVALIFGIYENLLTTITSINISAVRLLLHRRFRAFSTAINLRFIALLGLGLVTAIVTLSEPLGRTLDNAAGRIILYAFFFGLVVASVAALGGRLNWSLSSIALFAAGTAIGFGVVRLSPATGSTNPLAVFGAGAIAICAMVLPGISGSFLLIILGQYEHILDAVRGRNLGTILVFGAGTVVGLLSFSRLLRRLLSKHGIATMAVLIGFMTGSLWKIWPWRLCLGEAGPDGCIDDTVIAPIINRSFWWAIAAAVIGAALVTTIDHVTSADNLIVRTIRRSERTPTSP